MTAHLSPHLAWPFFADTHRALAAKAGAWVAGQRIDPADTDAACRAWVRALGASGLLRYTVPREWGGALETLDSRALCILRETLAAHDGLADFAFAMQGLGSGAITLGGGDALRRHWLPRVAAGEAIAAFALSEPDAGSDAGAMTTSAERVAGGWRIDGEKSWISNGGIADFYCVFARTDAASTGAKGISAFLVPARTPGLDVSARIAVMSPHPLATVQLYGCVVPEDHLLGEVGAGFALAMRTLDIFRTSVAAAAVGFARRALAETLAQAHGRACSARRSGASRWRRRSSATWRPTSMRRPCSPTAPPGSATRRRGAPPPSPPWRSSVRLSSRSR